MPGAARSISDLVAMGLLDAGARPIDQSASISSATINGRLGRQHAPAVTSDFSGSSRALKYGHAGTSALSRCSRCRTLAPQSFLKAHHLKPQIGNQTPQPQILEVHFA